MLKLKKDFPVFKNNPKIVFLDSSSGSLKPKVVIDSIKHYYENYSCNVQRSEYHISREATKIIEETREDVRKFINAKKNSEIIFTSGTTDSTNKGALSFVDVLKKDDEIIISRATHSSNVLPWKEVSLLTGAKIVIMELDDNQKITLKQIKKYITNKTKVISIETISNVIGKSNECIKIGEYISKMNIYYFLDAAQSIAHVETDVQKFKCHMLAFSGNKIMGPTGSGCLYINEKIHNIIKNKIKGGGTILNINDKLKSIPKNYPSCFEPGTPNLAAIFGLKAAIKYLNNIGFNNIIKHEQELLKYTYEQLQKIVEVTIYNPNANIGIICFNYKGIFCEDLGNKLGRDDICVRNGDNCSKLLNKFNETNMYVRVSLYIYNDKNDIDKFINSLKNAKEYLNEFFS